MSLLRNVIWGLAAVSLLSAQSAPPAAERQLAHDIYKQIVEIKSGFTTGATTPVAQAVAARLKAAGFPESDIFVGGAIPTKANLVVRYHGTGARKPILLLAHTDVVEAKREDWSTDPFQFLEKEGFFYGRGTSDDKAQAAVWVANLIRYRREGFRPDRDIIVALTADEEGGGPYNGVDWLLKNKRALIDSEFCLNEGARGELAGARKLSLDVQMSEKSFVNFRFEVRNKGGHSSIPVPDNAIYHLASALDRLSKFEFPLKTNDVTRAYFEQMGNLEASAIKRDLGQAAGGSAEAMKRVAAASPTWNSMLRTTCVATVLEGGHAVNALPQLAAANVNCRILPEDSTEYVQSTLKKVVADDQVNLTLVEDEGHSPILPVNPEVMQAIRKVSQTLWPGVPIVPTMSTGATDGRYLRVAGIPTFGIQGFFIDRDDVRAHGRDERMGVEAFYDGQNFLYELVKTLAKQ